MLFFKLTGIFLVLYGLICFLFNVVGCFFVLPDFGVTGSWLFNPLGMLFGEPVANYLVANFGASFWLLDGLISSSVAWVVGGLLAWIWIAVTLTLGSIMIRH